MPASSVYDLASELLGVANTALATTLGGSIDRAFVSPGLPALDCCPMLSVHASLIAQADASFQLRQTPMIPGGRINTEWLTLLGLVVTVVRCSPTLDKNGKPPTATALDSSAQLVDEDAWALWNTLHLRHRDGTLFAGYPCRALFIDPALPITPQGGCAGWTLTLRVDHDSYDPEVP